MGKIDQTVYIIDTFSKFSKDKIISTFKINNQWFSIKEVSLKWGVPQLSSIEEDLEQPYFCLYNTLEEAQEYVRKIKRLEGVRY